MMRSKTRWSGVSTSLSASGSTPIPLRASNLPCCGDCASGGPRVPAGVQAEADVFAAVPVIKVVQRPVFVAREVGYLIAHETFGSERSSATPISSAYRSSATTASKITFQSLGKRRARLNFSAYIEKWSGTNSKSLRMSSVICNGSCQGVHRSKSNERSNLAFSFQCAEHSV